MSGTRSNKKNWRSTNVEPIIPSPSPSISKSVKSSNKQNFRRSRITITKKPSTSSQNTYNLSKDKPSRGILSWYHSKLSSDDDSIFKFTIPTELQKGITHNEEAHESFKKFFETAIIETEGAKFDNNDGDIITSHYYPGINEEDKAYLEKIKTNTDLQISLK